MALGMKSWIGLVVAGTAALAVVGLPVKPPRGGVHAPPKTVERVRATELRGELSTLNETVRRMRWSDSLSALTLGAADLSSPVVVGAPLLGDTPPELIEVRPDGSPRFQEAEGVTLAQLDALRGRVQAELASLGVDRPAVDVGVFVVNARSAAATEAGYARSSMRVEWYAGTREGRPYCLTVKSSYRPSPSDLDSYSWRPSGRNRRTSMLGPCGFYAQHGMPGPEVQRWMQSVGASLATERGDEIPRIDPADEAWTNLLGWRANTYPADLQIEACALGRATGCISTMTEERIAPFDQMEEIEPEIIAAGVPFLDGEDSFGGPASHGDAAAERMLDAIERRFGQEAFGLFWRSDRPFEEAFASAFGMTPQAWASEWVDGIEMGTRRADVMPGGGEWGLPLLYLGLALAGAVAVVGRRKLG